MIHIRNEKETGYDRMEETRYQAFYRCVFLPILILFSLIRVTFILSTFARFTFEFGMNAVVLLGAAAAFFLCLGGGRRSYYYNTLFCFLGFLAFAFLVGLQLAQGPNLALYLDSRNDPTGINKWLVRLFFSTDVCVCVAVSGTFLFSYFYILLHKKAFYRRRKGE